MHHSPARTLCRLRQHHRRLLVRATPFRAITTAAGAWSRAPSEKISGSFFESKSRQRTCLPLFAEKPHTILGAPRRRPDEVLGPPSGTRASADRATPPAHVDVRLAAKDVGPLSM